ncbi:MAG: carbamoyltransferase C-terminal domain-containing protein [Nitrospinota bacterium]|nr:carbamoyltransferase C-terminal domain-containing protein [Nitrospinota bacterium]
MSKGDILGFYCFGRHDSSVSLVRDGNILAAAEEERFSRRKFDREFPASALAFCLEWGGVDVRDLEAVAVAWNPRAHRKEKVLHVLRHFPASIRIFIQSSGRHVQLDNARGHFTKRTGYRGPFHPINHHLAHAASAFYPSPFEEAAVLTVDGVGEWETVWMGKGKGTDLERLRSQGWPHSLGAVYTAVTQFLGFQIFSDEYKVMGLAPYGEPARLDRFREIITLTDKGFRVDPAYFGYHVGRENFFSKRFVQTFGSPREPDGPVEKQHEDLAASLQARTEEVLIHLARIARIESGSPNLCLAGGVALNSVAVGKIIDEGVADRIFIPPCAGDAGVSLGAALYVSHAVLGMDRAAPLRDARLGPEWGEAHMRAALAGGGLEYEVSADVISAAASALAGGEVIGWFQGRTEFGQRALGARSILADPRRAEMKDIINAKVKFREAFRPFAPSVQEERLSEFFHGTLPCPFMTQVYRVRDGARDLIPAVTHVDGTGRVQTVARDSNPLYWELLQAFGAKTGVPILLNTSFNVKGEPIVNTPEDAVACFLKADLDLLCMGNLLARKTPAGRGPSPRAAAQD